MKKISPRAAFTLIELLIVIAIIGILATLMFPAIQGAMNKANGVKIGNNGANIVKQIISANIEREANAQSTVWPSKEKWTDANSYFAQLMEKDILTGISYSAFAGAGVAAASDADELKTEGNIWWVVGGIESLDDATPFLWTRNLDGLTEKDLEKADASSTTEWKDKFVTKPENAKPFGKAQVVLVRKGGAMQTIESKSLTDYVFNQVSNDTSVIKLLAAAAGESTDEEDEF